MSSNPLNNNDTSLEIWRRVMLDKIARHKESFFGNLRSKLVNECIENLSSNTNLETIKQNVENKINGFDYEGESKIFVDGIIGATFEFFCQVIVQNSTECVNKVQKAFDFSNFSKPVCTKSFESSGTTPSDKDGNNSELKKPSSTANTSSPNSDNVGRSNLNQLISQSVLSNMSPHGGINLAGVTASIARDEINNGQKTSFSRSCFNFKRNIQNNSNLINQIDNNTQENISVPAQKCINSSLHPSNPLTKYSESNSSNSTENTADVVTLLESIHNILDNPIVSKDTEMLDVIDDHQPNSHHDLDLPDECQIKKKCSNDTLLKNSSTNSSLDFELSTSEKSLSTAQNESQGHSPTDQIDLNEKLVEKDVENISSESIEIVNSEVVEVEVHKQLNSEPIVKKPHKKIKSSSKDLSKNHSKDKHGKLKNIKSNEHKGHHEEIKKKHKSKHKDKKSHCNDGSNKTLLNSSDVSVESNNGVSDSEMFPEKKVCTEITNKTRKISVKSFSGNISSVINFDGGTCENILNTECDANEKMTRPLTNNTLEKSNPLDLNRSLTEKTNDSQKNNPLKCIDTKKQYEKAKKNLFLPDVIFRAKPREEQKKDTNETNLTVSNESHDKSHVEKTSDVKKPKSSLSQNFTKKRKSSTDRKTFKVRITGSNLLKCNKNTAVSLNTDGANVLKNESITTDTVVKKETITDQSVLPLQYDEELNSFPDWLKNLYIVHKIKPCQVVLTLL